MAKEMCLVGEREKRRLAGELHDSPMQKLALAQLQIAAAARRRGAESDHGFEVGLELLRDALQELRTLQFELSPRVLYEEGLSTALRWLVDQTAQRFGVELTFVESGQPSRLAQELALILFPCVRERLGLWGGDLSKAGPGRARSRFAIAPRPFAPTAGSRAPVTPRRYPAHRSRASSRR